MIWSLNFLLMLHSTQIFGSDHLLLCSSGNVSRARLHNCYKNILIFSGQFIHHIQFAFLETIWLLMKYLYIDLTIKLLPFSHLQIARSPTIVDRINLARICLCFSTFALSQLVVGHIELSLHLNLPQYWQTVAFFFVVRLNAFGNRILRGTFEYHLPC